LLRGFNTLEETNMALKIGYVVAEFPSVTETFVANEIQGLLDCGASVTVFALREGAGDNVPMCPVFYRGHRQHVGSGARWSGFRRAVREAVALEWPSVSVTFQAARSAWSAVDFAALAQQQGIQHLHAHFAFIPTDVALMMRRLAGMTVSFSAHAWDVFCRGQTLPRKLSVSRLCITCTDAAWRHVTSLVDEHERGKVVRIYHGTDLRRFAFHSHDQPASPPRILAIGRLVRKKGFETLLYACRRLRERMAFRCDIVGQGPLERGLKTLAEDLKLADLTNFYGTVPYGASFTSARTCWPRRACRPPAATKTACPTSSLRPWRAECPWSQAA